MYAAFNLAQPYYSHRVNRVNRNSHHVLLKCTNVMNSENCVRSPTPENTTTKRPRTSLTLQTPQRSAKRARRYVGTQQNIQSKSIIFASAYIMSYLLWFGLVINLWRHNEWFLEGFSPSSPPCFHHHCYEWVEHRIESRRVEWFGYLLCKLAMTVVLMFGKVNCALATAEKISGAKQWPKALST